MNVETAPLIEAALGDKAQHLVIAPGKRLFDHLAAHGKRLSGRVGFLPLDAIGPPGPAIDLSGQIGVIGRADKFVEAALELAPLVRRLLSNTWIVENLNHALALSQGGGRGANFVTLAGEALSAEGAVVVGQRHASGGLISRRSELRAFKAQIAEWDQKAGEITAIVTTLEQQVAAQDKLSNDAAAAHHAAAEALAEQRLRVTSAQQRREQLTEQQATLETDLQAAGQQCETVAKSLTSARSRLDQLQTTLAQSESRMSENARRIEELDLARQQRTRDGLATQVDLARGEQQLAHLRANCAATSKTAKNGAERSRKPTNN